MEIRDLQLIDMTTKRSSRKDLNTPKDLSRSLSFTANELLNLMHQDGYWWFALQANETIGAEFIFLKRFIDDVDEEIESGIAKRILDVQRNDGSWALYHDGPGDLSASIECYFALKLAGLDTDNPNLRKAREFILSKGGITKSRVFTRIHLAMFGLVPWSANPEMPPELVLMPSWFPINIYEFSSWARVTIVPLTVFMTVKPVRKLDNGFNLEELFCEPVNQRDYSFKSKNGLISWDSFFIYLDKILKLHERIPLKPLRKRAINKCIKWTWDHIQRTEDIYPAMAYGVLMFKALGYKNSSPEIQVPLKALNSFHQHYTTLDIPRTCYETNGSKTKARANSCNQKAIHQQCCISPVWDTPWTMMALLEAGISPDSPALLKAGRWLISKQITDFKGDWAVKNPKAEPGGWSFEFKNDYFPDVDDTIEIVQVLKRLNLPENEKEKPIRRGISWILSMQNDDGGWGAFDKNQTLTLVNKIPFSDHGACLDPSSPDITGRVVELLAGLGMTINDKPLAKAVKYLAKTNEPFGGWFGRWGVNYIYGTWGVLTGLAEMGFNPLGNEVKRAVNWLKHIQNGDGGFGESPESYKKNTYVPWHESVPTQTAWGLMGLVAGGEADSPEAHSAAQFLLNRINSVGSWDEETYTGTGFPGHFYIRYHGYRHFFPLLALARYRRAIS